METDSSSTTRPRILYVEREWEVGTPGRREFEAIAAGLAARYDLVTYRFGLSPCVVDIVREGLCGKRFDAVVTHVPHDIFPDISFLPRPLDLNPQAGSRRRSG